MKIRRYRPGDTIAVRLNTEQAKALGLMEEQIAISCQVVGKGIAQTKKGTSIIFTDNQVFWVRGTEERWPRHILDAFHGNYVDDRKSGGEDGEC